MMDQKLEFILGRPGSGKTEAIFSRVAALKESGAEGEVFVIVPEQATAVPDAPDAARQA